MKRILLLLLFLTISFPALASVERHLTLTAPSTYNDYTEARYDEVLNRFISIMQRSVGARGGELKILRDWTDGAVNAWAWREGKEYWIEAPGGAARYYLINEEAFLATLCHELGHLMGGAPGNHDISFEGQSDYYSSAKCLRVVLNEIEPFKKIEPSVDVVKSCSKWSTEKDRELCERSVIGALSLTSYYAQLEKVANPQISTPSRDQVTDTLQAHPKAQCRFDTYLAGALCPIEATVEFGEKDWRQGACTSVYEPTFARPSCWFRETNERRSFVAFKTSDSEPMVVDGRKGSPRLGY
jgi:hypothetical protein